MPSLFQFISSIHNSNIESPVSSEKFSSSSSKNNVLQSTSDESDSLSIASVSSCGNFSYSDDEALSSTSCELPSSPNRYPHGIINPNYPGFQHFAHTLSDCYPCPSFSENGEYVIDRNNNAEDDESSSVDLSTYLKLYQTDSDIKIFEDTEQSQTHIISSAFESKSTPPDLVFEHHAAIAVRDQEEHQPDLIKNLNQINEMIDDTNCSIVGDFGKEIAEELDTGYNFKLFKNVQMTSNNTFKKTEDAKLSSATDKIPDKKEIMIITKEKVIENPEVIENNNKSGKE